MTAGRSPNGRGAIAFVAVFLAVASGAWADLRFGAPRNLGPAVNSAGSDGSPDISADGQTLYFDSLRPGGTGDWDIWMTTRTPEGNWSEPEPLPWPVNSVFADAGASISADGLSLYFASDRFGGYGSFDLWVTTRNTKNDPWEPAVNLGSRINTYLYENHPCISADGLSLYFDSSQPWGLDYDIWVTTRKTTKAAWGTPVNLGSLVNSGGIELSPSIHAGNLVLFFDSRTVDRDIWMVVRHSPGDAGVQGRQLQHPGADHRLRGLPLRPQALDFPLDESLLLQPVHNVSSRSISSPGAPGATSSLRGVRTTHHPPSPPEIERCVVHTLQG